MPEQLPAPPESGDELIEEDHVWGSPVTGQSREARRPLTAQSWGALALRGSWRWGCVLGRESRPGPGAHRAQGNPRFVFSGHSMCGRLSCVLCSFLDSKQSSRRPNQAHPGDGRPGPGGKPRARWAPNLAEPLRLGRERGLDFPLGCTQQRFPKQNVGWDQGHLDSWHLDMAV